MKYEMFDAFVVATLQLILIPSDHSTLVLSTLVLLTLEYVCACVPTSQSSNFCICSHYVNKHDANEVVQCKHDANEVVRCRNVCGIA
jgi:hypothetical protein